MQKNKGQSSWISLSDLMTGLMLVFLLIVVIMQTTLVRYENTKQKIYHGLKEKLADEEKSGKVKISQELVVRFHDATCPFEQDKASISPPCKKVLNDFIPKYLTVLQNKDLKDHIQEVRIEGHTARSSPQHPEYIDLVKLSQNRARAILQYFVSNEAFKELGDGEEEILRFKLMANGLGNGRLLDEDGKYVIDSAKPPSPKSRRVEFRIMTDADEAIMEATKTL